MPTSALAAERHHAADRGVLISKYGRDDGSDEEDGEHAALVDWNLDNFEQNPDFPASGPILTSPRSIEACRMLGIEADELIPRSAKHFLRSKQCNGDPELAAKRAARYERTRLAQLDKARAQRRELIEVEHYGARASMSLVTRSLCRSPEASNGKLCLSRVGDGPTLATASALMLECSALAREQRELERMQQRQAQEMQQMLSFERQMAAIQSEREKRAAEKKRQDELIAKERTRRQRLADEERRRKELERAEQARLELECAKRVAQQQHAEKLRKVQRAKQEEERRRREAQQSERERLQRVEEARMQTELNQLAQERAVMEREQEIARREARQREQRERQQRIKAQELAEKQEKNKLRILRVLEDKEVQRAEQLTAAARKQQESETRRRQFEEERRQRDAEIQDAARRKKEAIEIVQSQVFLIEEQRRERLREQERQTAARMQQAERDKQREREEQRRAEQRLAEERRRVYERMEEQLREKQTVYYRRSEQKEAVTQAVQEHKRAIVRERLQDARLREEEIQTALSRRQKQDAYRTNLLLSRIQNDDKRAKQLKEQRQNLLRRRQLIKQAASRQKREILESFYRMKVTKKYELPKHLMESVSMISERPHSASGLATRSLTDNETRGATLVKDHERQPGVRQRPSSATIRRPTRSTDRERAASLTARDQAGETDEVPRGVVRDGGSPCGADTFKQELDELRREQNETLLQVLEEEHHAEEQREFLLRQALGQSEEHVRLESIFDKERAQASERIMKLTERHEEELAMRTRLLRASADSEC